jgi:hypothetical protein
MPFLLGRIALFAVFQGRASALLSAHGEPHEEDHRAADLVANSSLTAGGDVLVLSLDKGTNGHMMSTIFGEPYAFSYSFATPEGLPMNAASLQQAFGVVEQRRPKLALWLLPFDRRDQNLLGLLSTSFEAARRTLPFTRHGVFHWAPEQCSSIPMEVVANAYRHVDFVFQFGNQDERLSAKNPKYMPWPLRAARQQQPTDLGGPTRKRQSQRRHFAVYRDNRGIRGPSFDGFQGVIRAAAGSEDGQPNAKSDKLLATSQYALCPAGPGLNLWIHRAVESGSVPVVVLPGRSKGSCKDNGLGLYGLPSAGATAYPWIPAAPFHVLGSWMDLGDYDSMNAEATDNAGERLLHWYKRWLAAFHDRLELAVQSSSDAVQEPAVYVVSIGGVGTTSFIHELSRLRPPITTNSPKDEDQVKHLPFGRLVQGGRRPEKIVYLFDDPVHALESLQRRGWFLHQSAKVRSDPIPDDGSLQPENLSQYAHDEHEDFFQLEQHFDSYYNQCEVPVAFLRASEKTDHPKELAAFLNTSKSEITRVLRSWTQRRETSLAAEQQYDDARIRVKLQGLIQKYDSIHGFKAIIPGKDCETEVRQHPWLQGHRPRQRLRKTTMTPH